MMNIEETVKQLEQQIADLKVELQKSEYSAYRGDWYETYWHSTHKAWAVRLRPMFGENWIGLFDNRSDAVEMVDELDKKIIWAKEESRKR